MSSHYMQVTVTPSSEDWIGPYLEVVPGLVERHGGRYLAQATEYERLEGQGDNPSFMVIMEWPSKEAAEAFYSDPAYQPHKAARLAGAENHMFLIPAL